MNSKKIILDLCGGTGAWSKPYKDAGYDVRLITLPSYDVTKVEFHDHCMSFLRQDVPYRAAIVVRYVDAYGILAAPPCTEFSLAKNGSGKPRNIKAGRVIVEACERIIRVCMENGNLGNGKSSWIIEKVYRSS